MSGILIHFSTGALGLVPRRVIFHPRGNAPEDQLLSFQEESGKLCTPIMHEPAVIQVLASDIADLVDPFLQQLEYQLLVVFPVVNETVVKQRASISKSTHQVV